MLIPIIRRASIGIFLQDLIHEIYYGFGIEKQILYGLSLPIAVDYAR